MAKTVTIELTNPRTSNPATGKVYKDNVAYQATSALFGGSQTPFISRREMSALGLANGEVPAHLTIKITAK